ncbi:MAG: hypothetical protein LBN93_11650 [Candidatus Symbiothrix sp.]|jgi:hypothetical protein|nr:hypothetical protein [Candidatus Symbiothrix sp.]
MDIRYKYRNFVGIALLLTLVTIKLFGQIPVIKTPQPATFPRYGIGGANSGRNNIGPNVPNFNRPDPRSYDSYEQDRLEVQRRNAEIQRVIDESFEFYSFNHSAQYDFPSQTDVPGTEYYRDAAEKLNNMLNGTTSLNLKEAVYLVENAYFEGQIDYARYNKAIQDMANLARQKAQEDNYNWNNPVAKNMMLFRVMSDTLTVKTPGREGFTTSYPMKYDFDDYWAKYDYSKMFVTKLLSTHGGQCHSMPLLYLILCDEIGAEANLAFAPAHTYIKFKDNENNWHNLELTRGWLVTDAFVIGSGFITSEAIKNGVYMQPQTKEQTIAHCLSDLALGYIRKYGYDPFVKQCLETALQYAPYNSSALRARSNYQSFLFEYLGNQAGRPPLESLKDTHPHLYKIREERDSIYRLIDNIGLRDMPKELYDKWLHSLDDEAEKYKNEHQYQQVIRLTK